MQRSLTFGDRSLSLVQPVVMGILNVTPDSFSDGGKHETVDTAVDAALKMHDQGAAIIDVGGESTRPGAQNVSVEEELRRTVDLVARLTEAGLLVSIDTSKPQVMKACVEAGAFLINDVRALQEPGAVLAAAETGAPICLMHMLGEPTTMQKAPVYDDVVSDVASFLLDRIKVCEAAGISRDKLLIDPGFGFGKTVDHNLELLNRMQELSQLDVPVLVGLSRKSLFGKVLGLEVQERLHASVAAGLMAVERGARVIRAHDVQATVEAIGVYNAVTSDNREPISD